MMKYGKCILKLETVQKSLNLGLMELIPIIYVILLFSLMLDRYLAARDPSKYRKSSETTKHRLYILLYWIFAIISVSPLISGSVANYPFPDRYSCQVRTVGTVNDAVFLGIMHRKTASLTVLTVFKKQLY